MYESVRISGFLAYTRTFEKKRRDNDLQLNKFKTYLLDKC